MGIKRRFWILALLSGLLFIADSCEKQPRCGCNGDVLFELIDHRAKIYYNEGNVSAYLVDREFGSTFTLCNPAQMMDTLSTFGHGANVLVSAEAFNDCTYMSSYSYYYSGYGIYMCTLTSIKEDIYSK